MSEFSSFIWPKQPLHWHNIDNIFTINKKMLQKTIQSAFTSVINDLKPFHIGIIP